MGERIFNKLSTPGELYQDPIFVFAADPLASGGIHGLGQITSPKPHYRTHPEFLQLQKENKSKSCTHSTNRYGLR